MSDTPTKFDDGEIAEVVGAMLNGEISIPAAWTFEANDLGEIEVTTASGQRFRFTAEEVHEEDDQ